MPFLFYGKITLLGYDIVFFTQPYFYQSIPTIFIGVLISLRKKTPVQVIQIFNKIS